MTDIFYPDNPKRQERLTDLVSQSQNSIAVIKDSSERMRLTMIDIAEHLKLFPTIIQKIMVMAQLKHDLKLLELVNGIVGVGNLSKEQLQASTKKFLDYRFIIQKILSQVQCVSEGLAQIKNITIGGQLVLKMANSLMKEGKQEKAIEVISKLDIEDEIKKINSSRFIEDGHLIEVLRKRDANSYRDPEVEDNWKPISEQQFIKLYGL